MQVKCPHCPKERPFSKAYKNKRNKTCGSKECLSKHLTITSQGNSKNWSKKQ